MSADIEILDMMIKALGKKKGCELYEKNRKNYLICNHLRPCKEIFKNIAIKEHD